MGVVDNFRMDRTVNYDPKVTRAPSFDFDEKTGTLFLNNSQFKRGELEAKLGVLDAKAFWLNPTIEVSSESHSFQGVRRIVYMTPEEMFRLYSGGCTDYI